MKMYETKGVRMRISAIQPNYINRISFSQNGTNTTDKPTDETRKNVMSKNTQIAVTAGVGALALIGLVYAGYRGKLGAKIQKLLGGANDAAKNVERNMSDVNGNGTKANVKPDNVDIKPNSTTDSADEIKIIGGEEPKKVFDTSDAEDVEIIEDIHKFLTPEEFKTLPREEVAKRVSADLDEITKTSNDVDEYSDAVENYLKKYGIDDMNEVEEAEKYAYIWDISMDKAEAKFIDELTAKGELNEFMLGRARIKFLMGEHENAEKMVMDVVNKVGLDSDKLESYVALKKIADKSETPEKYFQIINKELEKDSETANELQIAVREHVEKFGRREEDLKDKNSDVYKFLTSKLYFESLDHIFDDLSVTGGDVPMRDSIKAIIESNKEIETFILRKAAN